jgi:hypothetical protein
MDSDETDQVVLAEIRRDLDRLVRRLRTLSPAAWRARRAVICELLEALVAFDASVSGTLRAVPDLPDYALADAVSVMAADSLALVAGTSDEASLVDLGGAIRVALDRTK